MERYDYRKAIEADIRSYLEDNDIDLSRGYDEIFDELFIADSVTGNGSGSYTFNAWEAEEYLCHNLDLFQEAAFEFCATEKILKQGAEAMDVTIRCYLLGEILNEVLEDYDTEPSEEGC